MTRADVLRELDNFSRQKRPVPIARDQDAPTMERTERSWSRTDKIFVVVAGASVAAVAVSVAALAAGSATSASNAAARRRARRGR